MTRQKRLIFFYSGSLNGLQITEHELGELGVGLLASIYTLRHQGLKGKAELGAEMDRHLHTPQSDSNNSDQSTENTYESDEF